MSWALRFSAKAFYTNVFLFLSNEGVGRRGLHYSYLLINTIAISIVSSLSYCPLYVCSFIHVSLCVVHKLLVSALLLSSSNMSGRQNWPLSQVANKQKGICSVCHETRQLHGKDGKVHLHGPRDNRCPGSNKPPLSVITCSNIPSSVRPVPTSETHHSTGMAPPSPTQSEAPLRDSAFPDPPPYLQFGVRS